MRRKFATKSSLSHTSLQSFIDYASASNLNRSSTVYKGTLFEYTVLETLTGYGFQLYRTGGNDDKGIDLRGSWHLSPTTHLDVAIQCKHEAKKIGPKYVRELGGIKAPNTTLLMLASFNTYTPLAIQALMASTSPLCLGVIEPDNQDFGMGRLRQMIWNVAATNFLGPLQVKILHHEGDARLKLMYDKKIVTRAKKN